MNQENLDKFIDTAVVFDTLKFVPRLPTKRIPINLKESVGIHIYEMQYLALLVKHSSSEVIQNLDWVAIYEMILTHEMEEPFSSDIPYSFKKELDNRHPGTTDTIKKAGKDIVNSILPNEILGVNTLSPGISKLWDIGTNPNIKHELDREKDFVKFLDYVNLYLFCISMDSKGYPLTETAEECKRLTVNHRFYLSCPLVVELISNPHKFLDKDFN